MTSIGKKVEHVLAARDTKGHHCHWPNCDKHVPPARWGCKRHWYTLPPEIRRAIWDAYNPGQETSKDPSGAYITAAKRAQEWIAGFIQHFPHQPSQGKLF